MKKDVVDIVALNTCLKIFFKDQNIILPDKKRIHFINIVHKYLCRTIEENRYETERFEELKNDNQDEALSNTGQFHPVENYHHIIDDDKY